MPELNAMLCPACHHEAGEHRPRKGLICGGCLSAWEAQGTRGRTGDRKQLEKLCRLSQRSVAVAVVRALEDRLQAVRHLAVAYAVADWAGFKTDPSGAFQDIVNEIDKGR